MTVCPPKLNILAKTTVFVFKKYILKLETNVWAKMSPILDFQYQKKPATLHLYFGSYCQKKHFLVAN